MTRRRWTFPDARRKGVITRAPSGRGAGGFVRALICAALAAAPAACRPPEPLAGEQGPAACSDGADNDGDGAIDCDDPTCVPLTVCSGERENTVVTCVDDIDNDGDGWTDCADPACIGIAACAERGDALCGNGTDDDLDGLVDCSDPTCAGALPCQPPPPEMCVNGVDDDGDGDTDCDDADCSGEPTCTAAPALQVGDCAGHLFTAADPDTAALAGPFGVTESQLAAALMAAKPTYGTYDFSGWGCRWFVVDIMIPAAGATVNAFYSSPAEPRDFMMACRNASGAILGDDDLNGANCTFFASDCGPQLSLAPGLWTCFFSVSPFDVIGNGNSPTGGSLQVCVNP